MTGSSLQGPAMVRLDTNSNMSLYRTPRPVIGCSRGRSKCRTATTQAGRNVGRNSGRSSGRSSRGNKRFSSRMSSKNHSASHQVNSNNVHQAYTLNQTAPKASASMFSSAGSSKGSLLSRPLSTSSSEESCMERLARKWHIDGVAVSRVSSSTPSHRGTPARVEAHSLSRMPSEDSTSFTNTFSLTSLGVPTKVEEQPSEYELYTLGAYQDSSAKFPISVANRFTILEGDDVQQDELEVGDTFPEALEKHSCTSSEEPQPEPCEQRKNEKLLAEHGKPSNSATSTGGAKSTQQQKERRKHRRTRKGADNKSKTGKVHSESSDKMPMDNSKEEVKSEGQKALLHIQSMLQKAFSDAGPFDHAAENSTQEATSCSQQHDGACTGQNMETHGDAKQLRDSVWSDLRELHGRQSHLDCKSSGGQSFDVQRVDMQQCGCHTSNPLESEKADSMAMFTANMHKGIIRNYLRDCACHRVVLAVPVDPRVPTKGDVLDVQLGALVQCDIVDSCGWGFGKVLAPRCMHGTSGCFSCEGMCPVIAEVWQDRGRERLEIAPTTWEQVGKSKFWEHTNRLRVKALLKRIHTAYNSCRTQALSQPLKQI